MPGINRRDYLVRFEHFELDTRTGELCQDGVNVVRLSEQPLRILVALLERPGELVLREDLRKRLWPNDTVVEFEHSINAAIKRLRQTLGDSAENPRFVETLARRGYRWKTPVEWVGAATEDPKPPTASAQHNLIGRRVAHYRILEVLGGGGMGLVYKAEDLKLGRSVALKFLPEELAADSRALERFKREARAASAADHPNICTIYEIGEHEGAPFIAMQLLQGQTLRARIENGAGLPILLEEVLAIVIQVAEGLDAAHREGVIHRDIKPANIFVTNQGQAKILDFGLAKLAMREVVGADKSERSQNEADGAEGMTGETMRRAIAVPFYSQTGAAMGTAGYMSPEQVRNQKIDARTDVFSFGLVLYEMVTGRRAFTGDTGSEVQEAILTQSPKPPRELNPRIPTRLERVISKALQKERDARYRSISEMRADLEISKREIATRSRPRWWPLAAACFVAILASTAYWFAMRRTSYAPHSPNFKLRQLTANSSDNHVISGMISPDGNYLAYTDMKGLHIKLLQTGEIRTVPMPMFNQQKIELECATWFPDSTRFLANSHPADTDFQYWHDGDASIWVVSVVGENPHLLRDNAWAWSFSPDGSLIAFGRNKGRFGAREIWLMDSNGQNAHKLLGSGDQSAIGTVSWFADGQRIRYIKDDGTGLTTFTQNLRGGPSVMVENPAKELKGRDINHGLSLPDGRTILSVSEPGTIGETCNFWVSQSELDTGKLVGAPRRLTNWTGFCMDPTSVTKDGKQLAFLEYWGHPTVYLADLKAEGRRVGTARHFTLTESWDLVTDWTADSKSLVLYSNRAGHDGIYKQSLEEDDAQPIVVDLQDPFGDPHVTSDGKWVVYIQYPKQGNPLGQSRIMRVPISGGSSQFVLTAQPSSTILCARFPSELCVVAERLYDRKQVTVTAFDPVKGRGAQITQFPLDPSEDRWSLDLSPDGTRFAAILSPAGPIHLWSMHGATKKITVKGWSNLLGLKWAADGRGLFVSSRVREEAVLLYVGLQGDAQVLWENRGGNHNLGLPSPDGRYLAIQSTADNKNMWMMEDF